MKLQFGRDVTVAEDAERSLAAQIGIKGFNSAATSPSRNTKPALDMVGPSTKLQFGRDVTVAEDRSKPR